MKTSNQHQGNQQSSPSAYIESLITPPQLPNPLKRSSSQKKISDSAISINDPSPNPLLALSKKITPMKKRAQSEDSSSQLFSTAKYYAEPQNDGSMASRISELTDGPSLPLPKEVTFR
jgi:hypothetical protein